MRNRRTGTPGFTLVELLIVVIILGVVAAIMIPKFAGMAGDTNDAAKAALALREQLTQYSNGSGVTSVVKTAEFRYGPYLRNGIPENPYNNSTEVTCDIIETDITVASTDLNSTGWKFFVKTGRIVPNHDIALEAQF